MTNTPNWEQLADEANQSWSEYRKLEDSVDEHVRKTGEDKEKAKAALMASIAYVIAIDVRPKQDKIKAKAKLQEHNQMSDSEFSRLLRQGKNPAMVNPKISARTPYSESTGYVLSEAPAEAIEAAVEDGTIHPLMTRDEAAEWVKGLS